MRCECCDAELSDSEATAKFKDAPGAAARYVNLCGVCRGFLPPEVGIITRRDLEPHKRERMDFGDEDYVFDADDD